MLSTQTDITVLPFYSCKWDEAPWSGLFPVGIATVVMVSQSFLGVQACVSSHVVVFVGVLRSPSLTGNSFSCVGKISTIVPAVSGGASKTVFCKKNVVLENPLQFVRFKAAHSV